ncbi:FAD binding domain-containing protein [Jannaschia aquimarina]|uniref:CutM protein n=1 Tax=Jannaschia aquimarina TaxID=935700 RepID=A0A0D1EGL9_9RHOB|nr:xanthine dehydrogenase family protein subunit M [Jannaschia aquimarina]KIT16769.1 Carbon monoxide dehydrogenase medium chain [Jannaschia aquimarina]SNS52812.1 carbon-monoxide dehydrogenase medium subunit [Jannaschia aquimarina]
MYNFELVKPSSVADAVSALQGEDAQALGGGQTLLPTMKARLAQMETLVSLSHIDEIKGVCTDDQGRLCVGGGTTHAAAAEALSGYPALASLAARIGDPAVRARGTIGGSLANDDPSACWPAGALGSGATIVAVGSGGSREIAADDFFQGMFTTALDEGEIITEVKFPVPEKAAYEKFLQPASRFPLVAAFVAKFSDGVRVAITGASQDGVFRWTEAEQALSSNFSADAVTGLAAPDGSGMISDLHGSGDYRAHLVRVMTARAVTAAS